jgi:hypothetical protein
MTVSLRTTLRTMQSALMATGRFNAVSIGEPLGPPQSIHASLFLGEYSHPLTTLTTTIERRTVVIRLYVNALAEPQEEIEFRLDEAIAQLQSDLLGDFDLGATVRTIDVTGMVARPGYQTVGNTLYRICDVLVPLLVDDSATFVA